MIHPRQPDETERVAPARLKRLRQARLMIWLAMGWLAFLVVLSLTVQWWPIHSPVSTVGAPNLGPSLSKEFLGTDTIGRSILSRLCYGTRVSMGIACMSTIIAMAAGGLLGLVSAYFRGIITHVVDLVANTVLAVPMLLLLLAIVLALSPTLITLTGALSLVFVPAFMRLTRTQAQAQMTRDYVLAARLMGAKGPRVILHEVLPNTVLALLSYAALVLPGVIVAAGSLSFLGFGVQPPTADWGAMIAQGQVNLTVSPWPALVPCIALVITVIALNVLSDYVRVRFDVRDAQL